MIECTACGGSGEQSRPAHGSDGKCRACGGVGSIKVETEIIHHSTKSVEHYTPAPIVDAARATLGAIDLDPASCPLANEVVKASAYYGPGSEHGEDGLTLPWLGRVFCNPPGGRVPKEWQGCGTSSHAALWWGKLASAWQAGEVDAAIFIGFTLEILRSAQALDVPQPIDFPLCVPKSRLRFNSPTPAGELHVGASPTHANVIIFLPPARARVSDARRLDVETFEQHFTPIGRVRA